VLTARYGLELYSQYSLILVTHGLKEVFSLFISCSFPTEPFFIPFALGKLKIQFTVLELSRYFTWV
jgi:hypothetical protein